MNDLEKIGWTIRKCRREQKMTQEVLAEKAGIDRPYLTNIENGHKNPSIQVVLNISEALEIPPWRLLRDALEN